MAQMQRRIIPASRLKVFEHAVITEARLANETGRPYKSLAIEFTGNGKSGKEGGGCSNHCSFCCLSSPKGPTHFMPGELIDSVLRAAKSAAEYVLYGKTLAHLRTDLFDYAYKGKTALDILKSSENARVKLILITSVPKGSENLVAEAINLGYPMDISLCLSNEQRIISHAVLMSQLGAKGNRFEKVSIPAMFFTADDLYPSESQDGARMLRATRAKTELNLHLVHPPDRLTCTVSVFHDERWQDAYFYHIPNFEGDLTALRRVPGAEQFSSLVRSGDLMPGTPFLLEYIHDTSENKLYKAVGVRLRSWDISPIGRAYNASSFGLMPSTIDSSCPMLLVDCMGGIYRVESVPMSEQNKEGMEVTMLRPPIVGYNIYEVLAKRAGMAFVT